MPGMRLAQPLDRVGQEADGQRQHRRDLDLGGLQPSAPRAARVPRCAASTAACASGSSARPAGVRRAPRGSRSNSGPPTSCSSRRICCDSDGGATRTRWAPARNEPVSAIAMKYCSWRRFTLPVALGIA